MTNSAGPAIDQIVSCSALTPTSFLAIESEGHRQSMLHLHGPDFVDQVFSADQRNLTTVRNLATIFNHGRLRGSGYLSILPVDQGVEHSAGASFAQTRSISIRKTSSGSPSRAAATRWPRHSACSAPLRDVRASHSVPRQDQPQRAANVSQQVRSDAFRHRPRGLGHGRGGVGATIYFGSERAASDRGDQPGVCAGA